ncbi:hypothetical protein M3G91_22105 [Micromonospora chalcea]|uniref:hypothetical protein n=1 Tax=Micromonospora chalcea TaxID=1874 RepID=UPI0021A26BAA|nr:hypothetical protein [Micromonospora chalcea]MCT2280313.1 hypothetical protein [Micromonospora chalcea]
MRHEKSRPAGNGAAPQQVGETSSQSTQVADIYAWTAVHLNDGRVVSLAWLHGWPGAVAGTRVAR